jgi:predicted HicB family RNase H-like nuclease
MMKYKGYTAKIEVDEDAGAFHGEVLGIADVVTFEGASFAQLRQAFHDSVDDYVDFCRQRGEEPEKPFSGKFVLRVPPSLHRELTLAAAAAGVSLNQQVIDCLSAWLSRNPPTKSASQSRKPRESSGGPRKHNPAKAKR